MLKVLPFRDNLSFQRAAKFFGISTSCILYSSLRLSGNAGEENAVSFDTVAKPVRKRNSISSVRLQTAPW